MITFILCLIIFCSSAFVIFTSDNKIEDTFMVTYVLVQVIIFWTISYFIDCIYPTPYGVIIVYCLLQCIHDYFVRFNDIRRYFNE